jgi:BirA family biotin operon repressor/biotin-[acetyl-CoA-carboxylase] ligase
VRDELGLAPDAELVSRALSETLFAGRIRTVPVVDSTNDELRRLASAGAPDGTVVLADRQTAGRGRRGHSWHSVSGLGLYLSVLFKVPVGTQPVTCWTLGAAVAACEACRELCGQPVEIKWPNDLMHEGRKLGGILAELRTPGGREAELVIGTGINVGHRAEDLPSDLAGKATSLRLLSCASMVQRESLAMAFLCRLDGVVARLRAGRWDEIARDFERLSPACRGANVCVRAEDTAEAREFVGVTDGVDPSGALLVRDASGKRIVVRMADAVTPAED